MNALPTSLPLEQFDKLCEYAIAQITPLVDVLHRGLTAANQKWLSNHLLRLIQQANVRLSNEDWNRLVDAVTDETIGYGVIGPFLRDPTVSEVMVNGPDLIYKIGRAHV